MSFQIIVYVQLIIVLLLVKVRRGMKTACE